MSQRVFAVFDIGTTGTRSVLVDEEGLELSKAYEEYPPAPRELATHEQMADIYWRTACTTMQRALSNHKHGAEAVTSAVVTTTRDCWTPVDKEWKPLGPTILWTDNRTSKKKEELKDIIGPRRAFMKLFWLSENKTKLFKSAHKFVTLDSLLNHSLCGAMITEISNARFGPIDHSTLRWSDEICDTTGIAASKFADIAEPGTLIGDVTNEAAKATGLKKGTPVILGCGDQQCSALGTGTVRAGVAKATTGTGTFVTTHTDEYVEDPYVLYSHPGAIPGSWILEGVLPGSGWSFRWYRDQYYRADAALAGTVEDDIYELMEASVQNVPAGSDGLVFFPFMALNKGILYNLNFGHTKAHIARAIMEGNGYGIHFYLSTIEQMVDVEAEELIIDGGGANSPLWRQIIADCTNKTVVLPRTRDSTVMGAAMLAAVGSGVYGSFDEAISNMFHVEEKRKPKPENVPVYSAQYETYNRLLLAELATLLEHY
jgi:xylulokinase